ncbi:hypothetical protein [Frigoribacterium faeni]|uniref:Tetratricopeptide repeat protein n=1 Tax=Frigoribacterium faeni TaxID=145483 RepID=A0A7W3JGV4_9MICO|nr:hypothetical protein [Frigoribacterium faeni]MBA8812589.1 hypothetical protein [Frigoribacterium faeni]GEK81694.1 hypothetical protein FFA01_00030 [Frigoribacterium faeni]
MTTVLAPPPVDDRTPADDEAAIGAYRRRLRRRLLLWSLPVVLIVLLVAAKLLSMPVFAALTQWSYADREFERSTSLSEPLGIANVIEPWVHHFDRGTGYAQIGVLDVARTEFATALELAPDDPTISCVIRTDLVLTIEAQGDAALLELRYADAEALFAQGRQAVDEAPEGCFQPPEDPARPDTSEPLEQADGRLGDKQDEAQQEQEGGDPQAGDDGEPGQGGGADGESGGGSSDPLDQLRDQGDRSQREQQQENDRQRYYEQNPGEYDGKPW